MNIPKKVLSPRKKKPNPVGFQIEEDVPKEPSPPPITGKSDHHPDDLEDLLFGKEEDGSSDHEGITADIVDSGPLLPTRAQRKLEDFRSVDQRHVLKITVFLKLLERGDMGKCIKSKTKPQGRSSP